MTYSSYKRSHGGNPFLFSGKAERSLRYQQIIDFSANINPLGYPPKVRENIVSHLDLINVYPDPDSTAIKEAISSYIGLSPREILVGNGSLEFIYLLPLALQPKKALIFTPTFSEYEWALKLVNAEILFLKGKEKREFRPDLEEAKRYLEKDTMVFLCNPNNPTGQLLGGDVILDFVEAARARGAWMILDEVFMDFVKDRMRFSLVKSINKGNLLILRSLTKFFSIPGLRIGYLLGPKTVLERVKRFQPPWTVNILAQMAIGDLFKEKGFIHKTVDFINIERDHFIERLKEIKGLKVFDSGANFILCKMGKREFTSKIVMESLLKRGFFIRDCANFNGLDKRFIRMAVRKREENLSLVQNLKEVLEDAP